MRLVINKSQKQGLMGGVSFEVKAQVHLTEEERNLVQHYRMQNEVLFAKTMVSLWGTPTDHKVEVRVSELLAGASYKCKDLNEVISYRESVKGACESLKAYLEVARTFAGQETYDFSSPGAAVLASA